ncbi:excinuclease ABC subunit C [Solemya pervernicosa gill symbiont]|uniref:UvrABC system protein C n=2 Tax=Gammaproteobacteria incertae sedis TaxID=118884 RepID=A0A1T2L0G9_9GAMM|nr:excinuclease ABC subunit UvrC [Candidatus Reidiella endopervernicosa]OOZ38510.1 excinuclease ABC subunit C [Solemya pervernicosa gill symbiont]QKQ26804.1 excinuclease ABC subunit UvrC [Candidatus Reidiella endopervernicosa]
MSEEQNDNPPFDHKAFLKSLTSKPGVYRMLDEAGTVIYVGKARNLKRRVSSYFNRSGQTIKTHAMVAQIRDIAITITHTESEALILENTLIKEHKPRYNVLLRDDKSYPYIYVSTDETFPRLTTHRGAKRGKGRYFGPYPNAGAVRESLNLLQKLFQVRQCEPSFFANRTRPCLQYQIKRCTAPCTGLIDEAAYGEDVRRTTLFLEGRNNEVIDELVERMEASSQKLEFEQAAHYRDQIANMRRVQEKQYVSGESGDLDVVGAVLKGGTASIQLFFIRNGRNLGNKSLFPKVPPDADLQEVVGAFIAQYYFEREVPAEILINVEPNEHELLEAAFSERAGRKVAISSRLRGERSRWLKMAVANAEHALSARLQSRAGVYQRFEALQEALKLDELPARMECFDISHTMGEATVASCVVFGHEGPIKSDYRRFNIEGITGGDDYAAMNQALMRRYTRLKKGEGILPDILFIDGGKGQLSEARKVLDELQVEGVTLVGVAKGPERRAGMEQLFLSDSKAPIILPDDSSALHLVQQIRDEAHRFAITAHRQRRAKARKRSPLEDIEGMGPKRRQQLLKQFGGLREIARAGVEDLAKVPSISKALAQRIYDQFHNDND